MSAAESYAAASPVPALIITSRSPRKSPVYNRPFVVDKTTCVTARYFDASNKPRGRTFRERYTAADGWVLFDRLWGAWKPPQWWQVDLEKEYTLDRVHIFPWWEGNRSFQYTIEVSTDEKSWTRVADESKNTEHETEKGHLHKFQPTKARYVRVNMLKNSLRNAVQLDEVRVYEVGK